MGSCRVGFRPGLCRSSAPPRRRAPRAWQDGMAAWASHWTGCHGAMVGRRALVVVWARSRRGHDAWAVAWVGRRRARPSFGAGWQVAFSAGPYWFLAPNGSSAEDDKYIGAGSRRGAGLRDPAYSLPNWSNLVGDSGVREASRPQPLPSELHMWHPSICTRDDGRPSGLPRPSADGSPAGRPSCPGQAAGWFAPSEPFGTGVLISGREILSVGSIGVAGVRQQCVSGAKWATHTLAGRLSIINPPGRHNRASTNILYLYIG